MTPQNVFNDFLTYIIHGFSPGAPVGEVVWYDSLDPKNFMGGWKVNPILTRTGVPTVRKMGLEEYRASRNLPVRLIRQRTNYYQVTAGAVKRMVPFPGKQY